MRVLLCVYSLFLITLFAASAVIGQTLKADYQFQGNLNSSVAGAPAMTNLTGSGGANSFATDTIDGYTRQTLRFPFNSGLAVNTAGSLIPNNTYTIVILFRFDQISGFRRVVSFDNRTTDDGAYIQDGRLEFESTANSPFVASTYIQVALVRDATGVIRGYRDGVQRIPVNMNDGGTFQISPTNILSFFQDDIAAPNEASAGNVARIRLYDAPMTTAQVQALDRVAGANGGGDQSIVFYSSRDGNPEIYSMNLDGSNQRRLTNICCNYIPNWSPDGTKIAFYSFRDGNGQIYSMNADGSNQTRLTNNTAFDAVPVWSPDGTKIAFSSDRDGDREVYVLTLSTSTTAQLTNNTSYDDVPSWSPDGSQLCFESNRDGDLEIFKMDANGANQTQLTFNTVNERDCAWSPNGAKIAFWSLRDGNGSSEIYTMNADGSNPARLTNNLLADFKPRWSPDSTKLVFAQRTTQQTTEVYTMNADGSNQTRLTVGSVDNQYPDWRVPVGGTPPCTPIQFGYGQTSNSILNANSCTVNTNKTDLYTFTGTAAQQVAVTMNTTAFFSKIELLDPLGAVVATAGSANGPNNSRLPASGYFTLPGTGTYTIRAISANGGSGAYTLSLYQAPTQNCTYLLGSARTNVPSGGGAFYFDVITQPGCPSAAPPAAAGTIYSNAVYSGGRVTFAVAANTGAADRQDTITVAGLTHTINQFGLAPPSNDAFGSPQVLTGINSPPNAPITGYNTTATAEAGEPAHAGNTAAKSVWYSWNGPADGLYSFSTSGSSFDTVMAIYACPASGTCTFANMTPVGANDDTTNFDTSSKVNFRAAAGTRYIIAIDGKNGASGTIVLSWRQYQRLFRLYLQNFNGNQTSFTPDSVVASSGANTVTPTVVSQGVYEFNLPADNSIYNVTITGPTGVVWDPNNFPLNTSFAQLDELMNGPAGAGQNSVSNATNQTPSYIYGYIKNITAQEIAALSVQIGSSRGPNPRDPASCVLAPTTFNSVAYARYQCLTEPQTLHDIIPSEPGKAFAISVLSYDHPINNDEFGSLSTSFIASNVATYNISGQVAAGGAGTTIDLFYTPPGNIFEIGLRTVTDAAARYQFSDLPPNTYRVRAIRTGFVFGQPPNINLQATQTVDIPVQTACTFTPETPSIMPVAGGSFQLAVTTNNPTCEWLATSDVPWIAINSSATVGTGPIHITVQPNTGLARMGSVRIAGRPSPVPIQQTGSDQSPVSISGKVFTSDGRGLRNATVSITDSQGVRRDATTSSFGFYSVEGLASGQTYIVTVRSRLYRFATQTLAVNGVLSDVNFVGLE